MVSYLPMSLVYFISDITYFIIRYIVRYRYRLVYDNVSQSYPDFSKKEIKNTVNKFYSHLCDYAFESISLLHMSEREIKKRFVFKNADYLTSDFVEHKNIIALFGHYCNWEWVCSLPLWNKNINIATLYKPLRNIHFDQLFLQIRSKFGTKCIDKNKVLREIIKLSKETKPYVVAFIADQTPSIHNIHYRTTFLNHADTAMLTGWENIARRTNDAVVFLNVKRLKRGYYEAEIELMALNPKDMSEYELTELYVKLMERTIAQDPALWLWSHNRWKYKK